MEHTTLMTDNITPTQIGERKMTTSTATEKYLAKMTNQKLSAPGYTLVSLRNRAAQVDAGLITYSEAVAALTIKKQH